MKRMKTLKKNYEFKNVINRGCFYKGKCITIYILSTKDLNNKFGIAVNTHIGKAVTRNRIKRLIRENYRLIQGDIKTGNRIIFMWNKSANVEDATFNNIKEDMFNIFNKVGLF